MNTQNPVNVRPTDLKPEDVLGLKVVAVIGEANDWAAYYGKTSESDEDVASNGDKLSQDAAELLFLAPVRAGLSYRR